MQRIFLVAVMLVCLGVEALARLTVAVGAPECSHAGTTLSCDYHYTPQIIHMEDIGGLTDDSSNNSVESVSIHNSHRLELNGRLCVSVSLENITDVVVVEEDFGETCTKFLELSTKNSSLNKLPSQISHAYLEGSAVASLVTSYKVTELQVVNSTIDVLDISQSCVGGISATFLASSINTLQELNVFSGSNVVFQRTYIFNLTGEVLIREGGSVEMRKSTTPSAAGDTVVLMGPEASLSLENITGSLMVKTTGDSIIALGDVRAQRSNDIISCEDVPNYVYIGFVTCLTLLMVLLVFFILTVLYLLKQKFAGSFTPLKEVGPDKWPKIQCTELEGVSSTNDTDKLLPPFVHELEELTEGICTTLQKQKSLEEENFRALEQKHKIQVNDIQDKNRKYQAEEIFINSELQDLDAKYKDVEKTKPESNWEALLELLKQITKLKEAKEKLYDCKIHNEKQELKNKANLDEAVKEHLTQLCDVGHTALRQWTDSHQSAGKTYHQLATADDLLQYATSVLHKEMHTKIQESATHGELLQYINNEDIEKMKIKRVNKSLEVQSKFETEHLQLESEQRKVSVNSSSKKLRALNAKKMELLTVSQGVEMKMLSSEHSENRLKIQYLDSMAFYFKKNITDVKNVLSFTAFILRFYVKLVKEVLCNSAEQPCENNEAQSEHTQEHATEVKVVAE